MEDEILKEFERATGNMSMTVVLALLGRIHDRLRDEEDLEPAADRIQEALQLVYDQAIDDPVQQRH